MKKTVTLSVRGRQTYWDQEPDVIELVTEGTLSYHNGGWDICYEESELTGLQGVTTLFRVEPDRIILTRTGRMHSQMVFQKGVRHDSLYETEFGTLMITVCAAQIMVQLDEHGGFVNLVYGIEIEESTAGEVDYHLTIVPKE